MAFEQTNSEALSGRSEMSAEQTLDQIRQENENARQRLIIDHLNKYGVLSKQLEEELQKLRLDDANNLNWEKSRLEKDYAALVQKGLISNQQAQEKIAKHLAIEAKRLNLEALDEIRQRNIKDAQQNLKNNIKSKKDIVLITSITTIIIILLSLIIFLTLIKVDVNISNLEMPAVYVVSKISNIFRIIYGFIILGSIFTTSVSLGTSFLKNTVSSEKKYKKVAIVICVFSVVISNIGFSNLINLLYPLFGYLGIIQMIQECHLLNNIKNKNILKI